jgi:MscS family membrane protein
MKLKLETIYRTGLVLLMCLLVWSVWNSAAQPAGAEAPATEASNVSTNAPDEESPDTKPRPTPQLIEKLSVNLPFLKRDLWGNELWKYLFSLIYIFLAFYVSKLLDFLTRVWLKKLAARTQTKFDDLLLDLLNGPVKIVAFIIFLRIGLDVFDWPLVVQKVLAKGFTIIVAVSLTYMVLKLVDLVMGYWRQRAEAKEDEAFNKQLFPIVRKSLKVFVIAVAALVTLSNIGVDVTAAIASLSIGGLALGLAAQDTLANLFGGISIFLDKPFRIGDRVQLDGVDGPVESIGLRSTRVRNLDGHLITIPNKTMGNATITNISARPNIKTVMNIGVTYDTSAEKVKRALKIIEEVYKHHPKSFNCIISFNKFESSSLNILVVHWWNSTDFVEYLGGIQEMNLSLKERFDAEKISFAFPTQTLYVKQDSDWRLGEGK